MTEDDYLKAFMTVERLACSVIWVPSAFNVAVESCRFDLLKWMYEKSLECNTSPAKIDGSSSNGMCYTANQNHHKEMVEWLEELCCDCGGHLHKTKSNGYVMES